MENILLQIRILLHYILKIKEFSFYRDFVFFIAFMTTIILLYQLSWSTPKWKWAPKVNLEVVSETC